jgi:hypothetical protein
VPVLNCELYGVDERSPKSTSCFHAVTDKQLDHVKSSMFSCTFKSRSSSGFGCILIAAGTTVYEFLGDAQETLHSSELKSGCPII